MKYRLKIDNIYIRGSENKYVDLEEYHTYLEIFVKFLHDYRSFFHFTYCFVAEGVGKNEAKAMYSLLSAYLGNGKIVEGRAKERHEKESDA